MTRNYSLEAKVKEAAAAAGALVSAIDDFALDVQSFAVTKAEEIPAWIEKCKVERPHRFAVQSDHDAELCRQAFVAKNVTAQGKLYTAVGEARFNVLKAQWADGIPESEKKRMNGNADHKNNPWNAEGNVHKSGRYTEDAIKRQMSTVRAMGPERAAEVAAVVGARLGQIYAPGYRNAVGNVSIRGG